MCSASDLAKVFRINTYVGQEEVLPDFQSSPFERYYATTSTQSLPEGYNPRLSRVLLVCLHALAQDGEGQFTWKKKRIY